MRVSLALRVVIAACLSIATGQIVADEVRPRSSAGAATTSAAGENAASAKPAGAEQGSGTVAVEKKLLGSWEGPACGGKFKFQADGNFELRHYTPGNNLLTGVWSIRWDALPPTLVLTTKTSDFATKDSTREEFQYLNKPWELKLIELDDNNFVFRFPQSKSENRYERPLEK